MCGSLRHENRQIRIGQPVMVINAKTAESAELIWSGFLQREKINSFWSKATELVPLTIQATSFTESEYVFRIPSGHLVGWGLKKNVWIKDKLIAKAYTVRILTRAPMNVFERRIHSRWPCCHTESIPYVFTQKDVMNGQMELI